LGTWLRHLFSYGVYNCQTELRKGKGKKRKGETRYRNRADDAEGRLPLVLRKNKGGGKNGEPPPGKEAGFEERKTRGWVSSPPFMSAISLLTYQKNEREKEESPFPSPVCFDRLPKKGKGTDRLAPFGRVTA